MGAGIPAGAPSERGAAVDNPVSFSRSLPCPPGKNLNREQPVTPERFERELRGMREYFGT